MTVHRFIPACSAKASTGIRNRALLVVLYRGGLRLAEAGDANNGDGAVTEGTSDGLEMRPSEYLNRNVRVTPFWFEPVDTYIERYGLDNVCCFSSDYPRVEGGKSPAAAFWSRIAPLGDDIGLHSGKGETAPTRQKPVGRFNGPSQSAARRPRAD